MKTKTIFKRKVNLSLLFLAVILTGVVGCQKGTFDINSTSPNSPATVTPKYILSAALSATASYVQGGNVDPLENWMGYWGQSGGFTPSTTYVLYQLTSSDYTGNFDNAYLNLENYALLIKTTTGNAGLNNYRAVGMVMTAFMYQRLVDLYNSVPYTQALAANSTFAYKYDDPQTIYKAITAKVDSAITLLTAYTAANPTTTDTYDVVFNGDYTKWLKFAKTLKLKILMRQTEAGIGSSAVGAALSGLTANDFLTVDAAVQPGYSAAAASQLNPFYADVVGNATGSAGTNTTYWRAGDFAVKFYQANSDPRGLYVYAKIGTEARSYTTPGTDLTQLKGRIYGTQVGDPNSAVSAVLGTGFTSAGVQKGPGQAAVLLPASESLFLQAEAAFRGYITGDPAALYKSAVNASFSFLGVPSAQADTYTGQLNPLTNYSLATDKLSIIITQKWIAMNSLDPLESYSDWRRLGIPSNLPVSIYPGVSTTHIPYRFPYTVNEQTLNTANVPAGGKGTDVFTSKIFWMK